MDDDVRGTPREFSITSGGPFRRLARRVHLISPSGRPRITWIVIAVWAPIMLAAALRGMLGYPPDPTFLDISVHVRVLVALPLLFVAERVVEAAVNAAVRQLYIGKFADRADLDRIVVSAERLRDTSWIEGALAVLALIPSQLVLWGLAGPTGVFHGVEHASYTSVRIWYATVGLPVLHFLALRWLWHWLIWTWMLARFARLPLAANATHPDRAAGLGFLAGPVTGFAMFELAVSSVLAGAWATQLLDGRATWPSLLPTLIAFLAIVVVLALGPLMLLSPLLFWAQRRALLAHGPLALEYVRRFDAKWVERRTDESLLGTSDIQSLADIGNAYQSMQATGMFVFSSRKLFELWLGGIVPMVPLILTFVPVEKLLRRIGSALFGGFLP